MDDIIIKGLYSGTYNPLVDFGITGKYTVRKSGTEEILAANLSHADAVKMRRLYKEMFGVSGLDIIETETTDTYRNEIFAGNAEKFSHDVSHNATSDTMFDVYIDSKLAASGLDFAQADQFIRESVNLMDCFTAIVEFLVSPEFTFDEAMKVLPKLSFAKLAGITMVQRHPAENDAPAPNPARGWERKAHNKAIKKFIRKSHITETRIASIERNKKNLMQDGYSVIDVRSMREVKGRYCPTIKFTGNRQNCLDFIGQRLSERGNHIYDYRIIRYSERHEYLRDVKVNGHRVRENGHTVCIGTKSDIMLYLKNRKLTGKENFSVEKF